MFESSAPKRLSGIIQRLFNVCTAEVLEVIEPKDSKEGALEQIFAHEFKIRDLYSVHAALALNNHNLHMNSSLTLATIANDVYDVIQNLSMDNKRRVLCYVAAEPTLLFEITKALNKTKKYSALHENIETLKHFIEDAAVTTWCYEGELFDYGTKTFKQVDKKQFKKELSNGFEEITTTNLGGIRMAYKMTCRLSSDEDISITKKSFESILTACSREKNPYHWKKGISILFPDKECYGEYILYVPQRLTHTI